MSKKIILLLSISLMLMAGCNKTNQNDNSATNPTSNNLQERYTNTKYKYSFRYPSGYNVETFVTTEGGTDLPSTPAKEDSNPVQVIKAGAKSWMVIDSFSNSMPFTEENIKKSYAIEPKITKIQIAQLPGYKLTFNDSMQELYFVQSPDGSLLIRVKIPTDNPLSAEMLGTLKFTN